LDRHCHYSNTENKTQFVKGGNSSHHQWRDSLPLFVDWPSTRA
jgi:hypothetical protein